MGRWLGIAALLALLAGAWWLVRGDARHDAALAAPSPAARSVPRDATDGVVFVAPFESPASLPQGADTSRSAVADSAETPRDDEVRVRVLDAAGIAFADVPCSLKSPDDPSAERPGEWSLQASDSQGRVRFPQARARLASAPRPWILSHDLPAASAPSHTLDRAALEPDEFIAVLPAGGALEVRVRELDGTPGPASSEVRLRLVQLSEREWKRALVDGQARYPWVELGRGWDIAAWRPQGMAPARARVRGPLLPDETVHVELVLGTDHAVVSFRAVDRVGQPFASVPLELARRQIFGEVARTQIETDAQGRFLVDGERDPFGSDALLVSHAPKDGGLLQGRAVLPEALRIGWNDGGEFVLESQPLLCAGRVVDPLGHSCLDTDVVAGDDNGFGWIGGGAQVRGKTNADGHFELRGLWDSDEFELRAEQHGKRSKKIRAQQGEEGLVLVLEPRHSISGSLAVDAGIDPGAVRFELVPTGGAPFDVDRYRDQFKGLLRLHDAGAVNPWEPARNGFRLEPVPQGTYALRCLLAEVEVARTPPFALQDDLDLGEIDLRGRIHGIGIVLRGAPDPQALRGKARWNASGSAVQQELDFEGDRVRLQSPSLPVDVVLLPRGFRVVAVLGLRESTEIDLEPMLRVRIVLETYGELPKAPYSFGCELKQHDLTVGEAEGRPFFEALQREIAFRCSAVGKVQVTWHLERSIEAANFGGAMGSNVLDHHQVEIEVRDVPEEQVFNVSLDGALLDDLVRNPPW